MVLSICEPFDGQEMSSTFCNSVGNETTILPLSTSCKSRPSLVALLNVTFIATLDANASMATIRLPKYSDTNAVERISLVPFFTAISYTIIDSNCTPGGVGDFVAIRTGVALGEYDGPSVGIIDLSNDGEVDGGSEINAGVTDGIDDGKRDVTGANVGAAIGAIVIGAAVVGAVEIGASVTGTATGADVVTATGAGVVGASDVKYTSAAPCVNEQVVYK